MKTIIAAAAFAAFALAAAQPSHARMSLNGTGDNGVTIQGASLNGYQLKGTGNNGVELNSKMFNGLQLNGGNMNALSTNGLGLNGGGTNSAEAQGTTLRGFEAHAIVLPVEATPTTRTDQAPPAFFGGTCSMWKCGLNGTSLTGTILE